MRERQMLHPLKKKKKNKEEELYTNQFRLSPWRKYGPSCCRNHLQICEDKKVIWNSRYGFAKQKSHWISLIALYDEMTVSVYKKRAMVVVYLNFSKAVYAVSL